MRALDPRIHADAPQSTALIDLCRSIAEWIAGSSPAMTQAEINPTAPTA